MCDRDLIWGIFVCQPTRYIGASSNEFMCRSCSLCCLLHNIVVTFVVILIPHEMWQIPPVRLLFISTMLPNLLLNKNQHPPNLIRPFANRRFNTLLPPTLSFLFIKPCFRLFLIMEG